MVAGKIPVSGVESVFSLWATLLALQGNIDRGRNAGVCCCVCIGCLAGLWVTPGSIRDGCPPDSDQRCLIPVGIHARLVVGVLRADGCTVAGGADRGRD